jgi:uncharacterized protein (UPF0332 family)
MNEDVQLHLQRASDCIAEAELLLRAFHPGAVVSRSYYAMFHAATAALLHHDIRRRSHQGIIAAFGQTFVKSGRIDARFHRYIKESFDLRQENDYQPVVRLTAEQAQEVLSWAKEFIAVCRGLCE